MECSIIGTQAFVNDLTYIVLMRVIMSFMIYCDNMPLRQFLKQHMKAWDMSEHLDPRINSMKNGRENFPFSGSDCTHPAQYQSKSCVIA